MVGAFSLSSERGTTLSARCEFSPWDSKLHEFVAIEDNTRVGLNDFAKHPTEGDVRQLVRLGVESIAAANICKSRCQLAEITVSELDIVVPQCEPANHTSI